MPAYGALPNFVFASEKTKIILSGYTADSYYQLFESNFPVLNFDNIVEVVETLREINSFALIPGLRASVKRDLDAIACNLFAYLRNKILENQDDLLPQIQVSWTSLSSEQKKLLEAFYEGHSYERDLFSAWCAIGFMICSPALVVFFLLHFLN